MTTMTVGDFFDFKPKLGLKPKLSRNLVATKFGFKLGLNPRSSAKTKVKK